MKYFAFLILFIFSISKPECGFSQWQQMNGPEGGIANCIEYVGSEIWAGTEYGVYTSSDEGASWKLHPEFTNVDCATIITFNDTIVVAYDEVIQHIGHVKVSADGGHTWQKESEPLSSSKGFQLEDKGIFKYRDQFFIKFNDILVSNDLGLTWEKYEFYNTDINYYYGFDKKGILLDYNVTVDPDHPYGLYYPKFSTHENIFVGLPPRPFWPHLKDEVIYIMLADNVTSANKYLLRSDNYGVKWDTVYSDSESIISYSDFICVKDTFFFIGNNGSLVSYDNGLNWNKIATYPPYLKFTDYITLAGGEFLFINNSKQIIKCAADYTSPSVLMKGIYNESIINLSSHQNNLYATSYKGTWKSSDLGTSWIKYGSDFDNIRLHFFKGDTIVFVKYFYAIMRSFDNGNTWEKVDFYLDPSFNIDITSIEEFEGSLFISYDHGVVKSYDWGRTWQEIDTIFGSVYGTIKKVNDELYAFSMSGMLYKYEAANDKWTVVHSFPLQNVELKLFELDSLIVITGFRNLSYSDDQGQSFKQAKMWGIPNSIIGHDPSLINLISINGVWFASFAENGVYFSNNKGDYWNKMQIPGSMIPYGGFSIIEDQLFSGSWNSSVWKWQIEQLEIISGKVYLDSNDNGLMEGNEPGIPNVIVYSELDDAYASTDKDGNYSFNYETVGDTLKTSLTNFNTTPQPDYYLINEPGSDYNFGYYITPGVKSLSIDLSNTNVFRPGFNTNLIMTISNLGSSFDYGYAKLVLDPSLTFISASRPFDSQNGDTIIWNITNLPIFSSETISIIVYTSPNSIIGDSIICKSVADPVHLEYVQHDNYSDIETIIVGSYDPNDKTCLQGNYFTPD